MKYSEEYWDDVEHVVNCAPDITALSGKRILITGASGMIGSAVADILFYLNCHRGYEISIFLAGRYEEKIIKRFKPYENGKDYVFIKYDATEDMSLELCVDYIIHGASNADPKSYVEYPVETMLANLVGTNALLRCIKDNIKTRLLYISSSEVYGRKLENRPYKEEDYGYIDIMSPRACYPSSKRAAETLCIAYSAQYGADTVIVRPGHIYGPSILETDSRASAQFTRNALKCQDIVMKSKGNQMRSYCYVLDCAMGILIVLLKGKCGEAYNISNKNSIATIRDVAETLAKCVGTHVIFENPEDEEIQGYNLMDNSSLDAEKLETLGWIPCFDLEQGIYKTILNMKQEK